MNYAIVFRLLGYILMIEGVLLLLPAVTSLIYAEWAVMGVFLLTAAISAALGCGLRTIKPRSKVFYMREGFAATALSWIAISIVGAVPFVLTGCIPNPVDALFETVSGFTTTGASILPAVEGLPNGILFWRSFTHWIGGMGVLVFLLSLLPLTGGSHVNLMKAESPGPQVDKLVPKVQSTAKILYGIYFALTVVEFCFLLSAGMNVFDSMLTAFGTAGTGLFPPAAAEVPPRSVQRGGPRLFRHHSGGGGRHHGEHPQPLRHLRRGTAPRGLSGRLHHHDHRLFQL